MALTDPLDIASAASNFEERVRVVQGTTAPSESDVALDRAERWRIQRFARKLTDKFQQEALHRSAPCRYSEHDVVDVLTAYRQREHLLARGDATVRSRLTDIHRAWLPTYQAALDGLAGDAVGLEGAWRRDEIYYGRYAKVCEPFLSELGRPLEAVFARHAEASGREFDRQLIEDMQQHLFERFELTLAWAVETDAKVYCIREGIDPAEATSEQYVAYMEKTFGDATGYHRFYRTFPVLARWLAQLTELITRYGQELAERLVADADALGEALFGQPIVAFRGIGLGRSDYHAGGQSVGFLAVQLADGTVDTCVYKPRCIRSESGMQTLLRRLAADGVLPFAPRAVLPRTGYGYEQLIPSGCNRVQTRAQAEQIYRELGGYLGVFYVLGGGDLHLENILVADGHAYVCDCETVLGVVPKGQGRPLGTLLDSVFKTGLLEWPRPQSRTPGEMRISGYAGGEPYEMPISVPVVNDRRLTFQASVTYKAGIRVEPDPSNRVFVGDRLADSQDYTDAITMGFDRVYDWFRSDPEASAQCVAEAFAGASARFINWGTQVYAQLLMAARHPRCLMEPLEVDLLVNTVRTYPRLWDRDGVLAERELRSLWRLDVPIFTAAADDDHLIHDHRTRLALQLETSPIGSGVKRIRHLSDGNRDQQARYIAASLSTAEVASPAFAASCLDYAGRIGAQLCDLLRPPSASAPWRAYQLTRDGITEVDVEGDLYNGSAGIALFLAYLDHLVPRPEVRDAAERALVHALARCDQQSMGAFTGRGGLIYVLTHLHHLWQDQSLLDLAVGLCEDLPAQIDADSRFDVLSGAAGVGAVMLGLAQTGAPAALRHAQRCAAHLLKSAQSNGETLSWPPSGPGETHANLTGFSHGAAGIGWALIWAGCAMGEAGYIEAGRRAFAYEARHFDEDEQDWYDLRVNGGGASRNGRNYPNAWCNGAAGIGLSRITSWARLQDDEVLLREAHQALAATIRNFPRLMNDSLCHGRTGNAELFVRFGQLRNEPAFRLEANVQVQNQWRQIDDLQSQAVGAGNFDPGLMIGMAGFGMHFLRLADPERVPSVLLLDPPATALIT